MLIIDNIAINVSFHITVINSSEEKYELKIPSGLQTGIKIIHGFDINENQTTELILDFNASKSIVKAGASGKWLLKPTVKVLNTEDYSIISGTITDDAVEPQALEGVLVSAQILNGDVVVQTSSITDEEGLVLPADCVGEVEVKSSGVFKGYFSLCGE